jgi:SPP1 gp7 family putative phage head morphogenesis protein
MVKRSGYIYSKRTSSGFQKMKRQGIVMPPFRIEDDVTRLLTGHYDRLLTKMEQAIKSVRLMEKVTTDSRRITTDGLYQEIMGQMQDALLRSIGSDKEKLEKRLRFFLSASQDHFFENFLDDADDRVKIGVSFALDKDEVFQQRLDYLMNDYLSRSLERIKGEEDDLKNKFLKGLTEYALGNTPDLESIRDVMEEMKETSVHRARFFARDQFARLNKSLTLASLNAAGVEKMQWIPVGDGRTRETHKTKSIKKKYGSDIFPFNSPPEEKDDYNCRCALVPVWED